jgi:hypothetical protein
MNKQVPQTECEGCAFKFGPEFQTAVHYESVYDKEGNLMVGGGNVTTGSCHCLKCDRHWVYANRAGTTKYTETTEALKLK